MFLHFLQLQHKNNYVVPMNYYSLITSNCCHVVKTSLVIDTLCEAMKVHFETK